MFIGAKVHALRRGQKMSLTELSQKSGVQMATLSRIENQKMVGTIESHINIAKALGVDITELYRDIALQPRTVELSESQSRTDVFTHSKHSSYEILTKHVLQKRMMPVLIRVEGHGKTNKEQGQPGSEKFVFVLDGAIEISIGQEKFDLKRNNTLYFDASLPHSFINKGKTPAKFLCVGTPVTL